MNIATSAEQYDAAYLAAQPAAVKRVLAKPYSDPGGLGQRMAALSELSQKGYIIDNAIMGWNYQPWWTVNYRLSLTPPEHWSPSLGMKPLAAAPGIAGAGVPMYNPFIVPIGGILNTLDLDQLPFVFAPLPGTVAAQEIAAGQ